MSKKKKSYLILGIVVLLGIAIDLITKILFAKYFECGGKDIVLIPNFFSFTFVKNTGAAFGMFGESTAVLTVVSIVFVGLFVVYDVFNHSDNIWYVLGISMLLSGAIGNFIDRIFLGYVRDFISIQIFPFVFNFADALITFGVICFAVYLVFYGFKNEKTKEDTQTTKSKVRVISEPRVDGKVEAGVLSKGEKEGLQNKEIEEKQNSNVSEEGDE